MTFMARRNSQLDAKNPVPLTVLVFNEVLLLFGKFRRKKELKLTRWRANEEVMIAFRIVVKKGEIG